MCVCIPNMKHHNNIPARLIVNDIFIVMNLSTTSPLYSSLVSKYNFVYHAGR